MAKSKDKEEPLSEKDKNSLLSKIKSTGTLKSTTVDKTPDREVISTSIPALNVALSGDFDGGFSPGLTVLAGPSQSFKSNFGLEIVASYLRKYPESICLFYDTEYGITKEYFEQMGVDMSRVVHIKPRHIEELTHDLSQKLNGLGPNDNIIVLVDSIGNSASKDEMTNALEKDESAADMGKRAKALKSFFRIINPHLEAHKVPCVVINHVYQTMSMYSTTKQSGGTAMEYNPNVSLFISPSAEKDANNKIQGYTFNLKVEKSRFIKKGITIPVTVMFEDFIDTYSGILDLALETGFIIQPTAQTYQLANSTEEPVKKKNVEPLLKKLLTNKEFNKSISEKYKLGVGRPVAKDFSDDDSD